MWAYAVAVQIVGGLVWLGGCCGPFDGGWSYYVITGGECPTGPSYDCAWDLPWNDGYEFEVTHVIVGWDRELPDDFIEVYRGDVRVDVPRELRHDLPNDYGCAHSGVVYDLSGLAPGTYTIVHRRSSAPEDLDTTHGQWRTFDGEVALVATVIVQ